MATTPTPIDEGPPPLDVFLKTVLRSGLLDREQLQTAVRALPAEQPIDAVALSEYLIRNGKLTRFQAKKLLKGIAKGMIVGPFQILALIGKGGMGAVYLARDHRDNTLVALKVLPPHRARAKERLVARFQREMQLSRRVSHQHLARTYEVGTFRGVNYLVMEYIPGLTLSRLVNENGPLPVSRAARLLAEVAAGLEHAHQQGLIHRDLKPSNILITPHDHAKVLDLGLAMLEGEDSDDPTVTGGEGYIVGSMDYIAPEQTADSTAVDARADIYGLGCTLFFALAGQPPFPGGTTMDKVKRHRKEAPPSLLALRPDLPPGFVAVVEKLMAKDPAERFSSARLVEEELWKWVPDEPRLPFDEPDDPDYVEAVTNLQFGEETSGSSWAELPNVKDSTAIEIHLEPSSPEIALRERLAPGRPLRWMLLIGAAIGIGLLIGWLISWVVGELS
jgi:serine/threonine protein kinase